MDENCEPLLHPDHDEWDVECQKQKIYARVIDEYSRLQDEKRKSANESNAHKKESVDMQRCDRSHKLTKKIFTLFFAVVVIVFWILLLRHNDKKLKEAQKHWTEREWDRYFDHMENRPFR